MPEAPSSRAFEGVWIPKALYLDSELNPREKFLLCEINSLDIDIEKGCYASNAKLAQFIQVSVGQAANIVVSLKKRGYVRELWSEGKRRGLRTKYRDLMLQENLTLASGKPEAYASGKPEHNSPEENNTVNKSELDARAVFAFWQETLGYQKRSYEPRKKFILARLKKFSVDDLKKAIIGAARSPYHQGMNDTSTRYDDIDNIFRNDLRVEKMIDRADTPATATTVKPEKPVDRRTKSLAQIREEKLAEKD